MNWNFMPGLNRTKLLYGNIYDDLDGLFGVSIPTFVGVELSFIRRYIGAFGPL
jgi:hypothetical protein